MSMILDLIRQFSPICIPLLAIFGVLGIVSAFSRSSAASDSGNWKQTRGKLLGCRVVTRKTTHRAWGVLSSSYAFHHVEIRYGYVVDGKQFTGYLFKLGESQIKVGNHKEGERIVSKFRAIPQPPVYYNPKNPEQAVLSLEHSTTAEIGNIIAGIVFIVIAIGLFLYFRPYGF